MTDAEKIKTMKAAFNAEEYLVLRSGDIWVSSAILTFLEDCKDTSLVRLYDAIALASAQPEPPKQPETST